VEQALAPTDGRERPVLVLAGGGLRRRGAGPRRPAHSRRPRGRRSTCGAARAGSSAPPCSRSSGPGRLPGRLRLGVMLATPSLVLWPMNVALVNALSAMTATMRVVGVVIERDHRLAVQRRPAEMLVDVGLEEVQSERRPEVIADGGQEVAARAHFLLRARPAPVHATPMSLSRERMRCPRAPNLK
jgi:hypothetical protein